MTLQIHDIAFFAYLAFAFGVGAKLVPIIFNGLRGE